MKRLSMLTGISALIGTMLAASAAVRGETEANLRLDWSIYGTHAPFYLALEEGLYEREGLNVKVEQGQGSATVSKLVAQGSDQFGFIDFSTMIRGIEQGLPITGVMRLVSGAMVVISSAEAPIESPKDLEGKVIAYAPAESTAQAIPALYKAQGVDEKKVSVLNPAVGAKLALFLQGRADAIPGNLNVQVAQIEAEGKQVHYFRYADFGVDVLAQGIAVNDAFLKSDPDAVRGFLKATRQAFIMAKQDPGKAVDALIANVPEQGRNRDILLRQWELTIPLLETASTKGRAFGWMSKDDWKQTQAILLDHGGLTREVALDELYTNDYLPASGN